LKCTIPNASAVVFRRSVFERVGGADENFRLSGDWMLWAKLLLASDLAFTSEPLNSFRMHSNSVRSKSARSDVALQEAIRIFLYIRDRTAIQPDVEAAAFDRLLDRWIGELSKGRFGPSTNVRTYLTLRELDQGLNQRLTRRFGASLKRHLWRQTRNQQQS
jgi:hypothetical protein